MSPITVAKTTRITLDTTKILESIQFAASTDLDRVDVNAVYNEVVNGLFDGITTDEILDLSIKVTENKIFTHYQYSYLAARLMLQKLY